MSTTPLTLHEAAAEIRRALLDSDGLLRSVAAGRQRGKSTTWRRAEFRYVDLKAGPALQLTTYDQTRARTRNAAAGSADAETLIEEALAEPFGNWHIETTEQTMQLRITKKGQAHLHTKQRNEDSGPVVPNRQHDREKPRELPPDHRIFHAVGLSDSHGRVKPSQQAKYRQVDEFLRILGPAIDAAHAAGRLRRPIPTSPLRVADLGCGNAYLTFAAAAYLLDVRQLPVQVTGIDVRPQARRRNTELAASVGLAQHMDFHESSIATAELADVPDVALSLHACDTATDEALARAIRWRTPLILAAPCCHHDLQTQLSKATIPTPYTMIGRHGILRERFADVLTDAVRTSLLRQHGYRVEAIQFVGSEHTPRNILLRAIRTDARPTTELQQEYAQMTEQWAIRPALARMLDVPPIQAETSR